MNKSILLTLMTAALLQGCHIFIGANGEKRRQLFPTKYSASYVYDTSKFLKQSFDIADFNNKSAYHNKKRVVETMYGSDIRQLVKGNKRYVVFFCHPCPGNRNRIKKLDSLGESALLVWLSTDYNNIDATLRRTRFAEYPYYTIDAKKNSRIPLERQIRFIREACGQCYEQHKDDVMFAEYLLVENGKISVVMDIDSTNILNR